MIDNIFESGDVQIVYTNGDKSNPNGTLTITTGSGKVIQVNAKLTPNKNAFDGDSYGYAVNFNVKSLA